MRKFSTSLVLTIGIVLSFQVRPAIAGESVAYLANEFFAPGFEFAQVSLSDTPAEHGERTEPSPRPLAVSAQLRQDVSQVRVEPRDVVGYRPRDFSRTFDTGGPSALYTAFGVGMVAAATGDLTTTELGLSRPGMYEANGLQRNRAVRVASHIAVPAFLWWATERARKNGHGKAALLVRIAVTAAYGFAVMNNVSVAGR